MLIQPLCSMDFLQVRGLLFVLMEQTMSSPVPLGAVAYQEPECQDFFPSLIRHQILPTLCSMKVPEETLGSVPQTPGLPSLPLLAAMSALGQRVRKPLFRLSATP